MSDRGLLQWPTWIGVVVDDLERQRHFWGDLLGLAEDRSGADFVDFDMNGGRSFELIQRSNAPEYNGLRFQVGFEVANIEHARQELLRRGVEAITDISPFEALWAYFRDPEGNVFEIKQRVGGQ